MELQSESTSESENDSIGHKLEQPWVKRAFVSRYPRNYMKYSRKLTFLDRASAVETAMSGCVGVPAELQLFVGSATINCH